MLEFHYAHFTRTFQKQEILVHEDTISVEVDMDRTIDYAIEEALDKVSDVFEVDHRQDRYKSKEKDISEGTHIWERELGYPGTGDFIRVTSTFPPEIQKKFEKDWDDYMDYLSMPLV